jgi:hypothetical protein
MTKNATLENILNVKVEEDLKVSLPTEIIKRLADATPMDALIELLENSLDEIAKLPSEIQASKQARTIQIELNRGRVPYIRISDYATGMDAETIKRMATKIGLGKKKFERMKGIREALEGHGYRAQGVQSYQAIAETMVHVSRKIGSNDTYWLRHDAPKENLAAETLEEFEQSEFGTAKFSSRVSRPFPGTDVYMIGVGRQDWRKNRQFTVDTIAERLGRMLGDLIKKYDLTMEVIEGDEKKVVTPQEYTGIPLFDKPMTFKASNGDMFACELYIHPHETSRAVEWKHSGVTYFGDLTEVESLNLAPFNRGCLEGFIGESRCRLPGGKKFIDMKDPATKEFVEWIEKTVVPIAEQRTNEELEHWKKLADQGMYAHIKSAIKDAIGEVGLSLLATDVVVNPPPTPVITKPHKPRINTGTGGGSGKGTLKVRLPNIREVSIPDPEVMSVYHKSALNMIDVNTNNKWYKTAAGQSTDSKRDYITSIMCKHVVNDLAGIKDEKTALDMLISLYTSATRKMN